MAFAAVCRAWLMSCCSAVLHSFQMIETASLHMLHSKRCTQALHGLVLKWKTDRLLVNSIQVGPLLDRWHCADLDAVRCWRAAGG